MNTVNRVYKAAKKDMEFMNAMIAVDKNWVLLTDAIAPTNQMKAFVAGHYGGWLVAKERFAEFKAV
jgi:hypothetical protein